MNRSVVVYGPQGCGKTIAAPLLLRHFGLQSIHEADALDADLRIAAKGALVLSHDRIWAETIARGLSAECITFGAAMLALANQQIADASQLENS